MGMWGFFFRFGNELGKELYVISCTSMAREVAILKCSGVCDLIGIEFIGEGSVSLVNLNVVRNFCEVICISYGVYM